MEKKNTVLLTVIAVATLLVAVVGATFAYFTATTTPAGNGGQADVTTTTVGNVDLTMAATTVSNELKYPGGYLAVGASVTATDTDTAYDYDLTYTVNGTITNGTATELTWTLYEVSAEVATPISGCTLSETAAGETQYKYTGCTVATALTGGTEVKTGTVAASGSETVTATLETLKTSNVGTVTYYYLVVNYPDNGNQNADQNKTISAELTSVTSAVAKQAA